VRTGSSERASLQAVARERCGKERQAIELLEAVRYATGPDRGLMIEMHGRFAPDVAARIALAVETVEPAWIEEPAGRQRARTPERARSHLTPHRDR